MKNGSTLNRVFSPPAEKAASMQVAPSAGTATTSKDRRFNAVLTSIRSRAVNGSEALERLLCDTSAGLGFRSGAKSGTPAGGDEENINLKVLHGVAKLQAERSLGTTDNSRYVLGMTLELLRVLARFQAHGIQAAVIKGPALAERGYSDILRRSFWDLDLLLAPASIRAAIGILRADGYVAEAASAARPLGRLLVDDCEYNMDHRVTGIHVELHWRFLPPDVPFGLDAETAIAHATTVRVLGRDIPALDPIDEIVYLSAHHGGKHDWARLRMVCDIAVLTCRLSERECHVLRAAAAATGTTRLLHTGILLAAALLDAPVPKLLIGRAAVDPHARFLARQAASRIHAFDGITRENAIFRNRAYLRSRERLADRLAYFPTLLAQVTRPTDREQELWPLPPALRPMHIVLRPFRLAEKYLRLMFSRAFRVHLHESSGRLGNEIGNERINRSTDRESPRDF